jgi:hypothetical protein
MEPTIMLPLASGFIRTFDHEYALAEVFVLAYLPAGYPNVPGATLSEPFLLASAYSNADGSFQLNLMPDSPGAGYACYLEHCHEPGIQIRCLDADGSLLAETETTPLAALQGITLNLVQTEWTPGPEDWKWVGHLMQQAQILTLDALAAELTSLAPKGIFKGWSVYMRIGYLYGLENAMLDPDGTLLQAGIPIRMAQIQNLEKREELRRQILNLGLQSLAPVFDNAVNRAELAGGHLGVMDLVLDPHAFDRGEVYEAVNRFFGKGRFGAGQHLELPGKDFYEGFPWLKSPLVGYRNYLVVDIWAKWASIQRPEYYVNLLDENSAVQQLNNRFHQDFSTTDTALQPANQLLNGILLHILQAPVGTGFGFGIAPAAIETQGEMSDREYLEYLISLSGEGQHELENRYRLNLSRSDLELSNPVQQNIETIQRFFTDSFQSITDPHAILPPFQGQGLPIINERIRGGRMHGPFFWQYEEWLERDEPFYAENYFDIRRSFQVAIYGEEEKGFVWGRTTPLKQFTRHYYNGRFFPSYTDEEKFGEQWSRNMIELQDLVNAAHNDFFAGLYSEAERKYLELLKETYILNVAVQSNSWRGAKNTLLATAAEQRAMKINDPEELNKFEKKYHLDRGWYRWETGMARVPYLLDLLLNRLVPACLSETRLALGKYQEVIQSGKKIIAQTSAVDIPERSLQSILQFSVLTGAHPVEPGAKATPPQALWWTHSLYSNRPTGSLPYSIETAFSTEGKAKKASILFPANAMEKAYFQLKLGDAMLEWADQLYRTNQPQNLQRARELYKGVLFLHGEDPDIEPDWGELDRKVGVMRVGKLVQNPLLTSQISRAHIGFQQINAGLNYYGIAKDYVPPVRYRVLREAAVSFATSAKSTQNDYLNYMQKYEQAILDEMTARTMVEKASYAVQIAEEQVQIAYLAVGEVKKQVEAVKSKIEAKRKEIKDSEGFFSQIADFVGGMKDVADGFAKSGMDYLDNGAGSEQSSLSWTKMYKLLSSKGSASAAGLTGGMAVVGGYGAFVYAGYSSMSSMETAANKRQGELTALKEVALPAAEKMVEMKQKELKISGLQRAIAQADYKFGQKLLAYHDSRYLSKAFWQQMSGFANRLMRRYLDLGGRTAWFAERALAFETDKDIRVVSFDYFPKHLRGVTGSDTLQLHLAEMEATRIYSLSQTIPVKQTFSMARDFPIAFGQLKKRGTCQFTTAETPLRLAYPGVYGYRLRCLSIGATYTDEVMPHKGMLTNQGISMVSRNDGRMHRLVRYPDALPLSEFNMRGDMLVYDLPDETLLPFEGSGIESAWELSLSRFGDATSLEDLTDVLLTFDMRASYSAALDAAHQAARPVSLKKSVLISGRAQNLGEIARFKKDGDILTLVFRPALAAKNSIEKMRTTTLLALMLSGVEQSPVVASLTAETDGATVLFNLTDGIALSNAGFLAAANGGVALPLNGLTGISFEQSFTLRIDAGANAGVDFSQIYDVQMLVEYEAQW